MIGDVHYTHFKLKSMAHRRGVEWPMSPGKKQTGKYAKLASFVWQEEKKVGANFSGQGNLFTRTNTHNGTRPQGGFLHGKIYYAQPPVKVGWFE